MDKLVVFSPVGRPRPALAIQRSQLETLAGKRVGFVYGMHDLSTKFWPVLEEELVSTFAPDEVHRHHKTDAGDGQFKGNTWIPAPESQIVELAPKLDYAVCGVGA
jgi:hypothetical protein